MACSALQLISTQRATGDDEARQQRLGPRVIAGAAITGAHRDQRQITEVDAVLGF